MTVGAPSPLEPLLLLRSMIAVQPGPAKALARAVAHRPHRIWDSSSLLMALWLLTVGRVGRMGTRAVAAANSAAPAHHRWQAFGCYYSLLKWRRRGDSCQLLRIGSTNSEKRPASRPNSSAVAGGHLLVTSVTSPKNAPNPTSSRSTICASPRKNELHSNSLRLLGVLYFTRDGTFWHFKSTGCIPGKG